MKYLLFVTLFLSLNLAHSSERERKIIEQQRENLTAFSYKTREGAVVVLRSLAQRTDSTEIKLEIIDALQEQILDFMTGGTAIKSLELIEEIALESKEDEVALKAIEILETKLEFSFYQSARVRITSAKSMVSIAESFGAENIREMVYDALLPYVSSGLEGLSLTARDFIVTK